MIALPWGVLAAQAQEQPTPPEEDEPTTTSVSFTDDLEIRYWREAERLPDFPDIPVMDYVEQVNRLKDESKAVDIIGLCDVWDGNDGVKRGLYYSAKRCGLDPQGKDKDRITKDYRRLLECKDIDVFLIATPDHWHAKMSIDAMDAGKAVYCEKPMTHTIDEARQVAETVKASPTTVGTVRAKMEAAGDVSKLDTRQDSQGRRQPARKPERRTVPAESQKRAARQVAKRVAAAIVESEVNEVARLRARVQELEAEVDQLKRENLDLQSEVDELRARASGCVARGGDAMIKRRRRASARGKA